MPPYDVQIIITIFANLPALPYLVFAARKLLKDGDPSALLMSIGGFLACGWEPVVDVLGDCFFPAENQIVGFKFLGRPIPVFVPLTYLWFVGGMGYWCLSVLRDPNTTRSDLWKLWLKYVAINCLLEYPPLYLGIYTYYGHHPFQVGGFPLWFPCVNASAPIVAATLTNFLSPYLTGWSSYAIITTSATAYGISHAAFSFPMWLALSTDKGYSVTYPAGIVTFILITTAIWIMSLPLLEYRSVQLSDENTVSSMRGKKK